MSDCNLDLIERDEDGNIKKVYQADGQTESNLYNHIGKLPIELSQDDKAGMYANAVPKEDILPNENVIIDTNSVMPQSITPENSSNYANLTEDGEGNFVFYHVGKRGYNTIKPMFGFNKATSSSEASALSKVGGMAMYYPSERVRESQVSGDTEYMVKVPKGKVYDFNSDPLNLIDEARELHSNENPNKSFDPNSQLAYITKVAEYKGFDAVVSEWNNTTRVQSTKALNPIDTRELSGNTVTKNFKNSYISNKEKGYISVIPKTKEDSLMDVYKDINTDRNNEGKYDSLYRLAENNVKMSQDEITNLIEGSDISQVLKDKYKEVLNSEEGKRESKRVVPKTVGKVIEQAPKGTFINVGMLEGVTNKNMSIKSILSKLPKSIKVLEKAIKDVKSEVGTESTLLLELSRPLTDVEMKTFLGATKQEVVPQLSDKRGTMYGTERWGEFNPEYFYMPNTKDKLYVDSETKTKDVGTGEGTQKFFGDVVTGKSSKYVPSKNYQYEMDFTESESDFSESYDKKKGSFDEHIATSIPTFRDIQVKKGSAIVNMYSEKDGGTLMYDLGGSEGGFVKTITEKSDGNIKTINLDPSPDMKQSFDKGKPEGSEMILEAFGKGWEGVDTHVPENKADIVHESMMFQFIEDGAERSSKIKELKDKYIKEDGLFITEEKFKSDPFYSENELIKNKEHKNKYYTEQQIKSKGEDVLLGMSDNQANIDSYIDQLKDNFEYVEKYWKSGNFSGIVASNDKNKVDQFIKELGDTSNKYNYESKSSEDKKLYTDLVKQNENNLAVKPSSSTQEEIGMTEDTTPKNLNKVGFLTEDFTNTIYKVKGDNTEYTSYKDALNNLGSSKVIEVSLNDGNGNYMNVATVEGTTDPSTAQGFINKYIKEGVLQETKTDQGGFLPVESVSGNTFVAEPILESDAIYHLGEGSFIKNDDGSYTIKDTTRDVVKVSNKKGEEVYTSFAELEKVGNFKELSKKVDDPAMVATLMVSRANKIKYARDTTRPNQAYDIDFTENDLTQALLDFLESMGVSVTNISDYVKNYNAKKGVDPSARALADIANRLIAFRDGVINIEDLTEETAHFIVEGWDQAEIQPLLDQVTSTKEWAEHSDYYRKVYKSKYPKELLEDAVKREVLGKILAKSLQNRFSELNDNSEANQETRSLLTKVLELFTGFIQKINEFITPSHRNTIGDFTNKVEQLLMKKELEGNIDQNNFNNNKFVLYSVNPTGKTSLDNILLKSKALVYNLAENVNTLKEVLATTRLDRNTARSIDKDLDRLIRETSDPQAYQLLEDSEKALLEAETLNGMSRALVLAENQSNYIKKAIESKGKLNQEESIVYQNLRNEIQPIVNALKNNIDSRKGEDYAVLKSQAEEIYSNIGDIGTVIDSIESDVIEELIQDVRNRFPNAGEEYENQIREWAQVAQRDSTKFHATFGQLMHSNDPLLGMMNYIIEDVNWEAKDDSMRNFKKFIQDLKENGIVDAKGLGEKITDYGKFLLSPYDFAAFQEDMRVGRLQILKDVLGLDESLDDIELMQKERDPKVTDLTREQDTIIKRRNTELSQSLTEQRYNKDFYEERNKRYSELDITSDTIDFVNSLSASRSPLLAKASVEVDGVKTIDLTKLTEFEREQLIAISKNRSESKTLHEKSGELKKGLMVSSVRPSSDIDYIEQGGLFYTLDPTVDIILGSTKIAWDLNRLDQEFFKPTFGYTVSNTAPTSPEAVYTKGEDGMYYVLDTTLTDSALSGSKLVYERSVVEPSEGNYVKDGKYYYKLTETKDRPNTKSKTFYKSLEESFNKEGLRGVKKFLMDNTSISFKDSYWDELLGGTPSIKNKFKTFVESDSGDVTVEDRKLLESILSNTTALKSILKMYKNPTVPTESLSDAIPSVIKSSIDSLEARIQSDYRQVRSRLDENNLLEEEEEEEKTPISENTLNSTVQKTLDGLTTEEQKLKYLESLLSKDNQLNLRNLRNALNTGLNESQFNTFFSTIDRANMSYNEILMSYSAYKLPSYYKRFAPVGYSQELDVIENLNRNTNSTYKDLLDFIDNTSVIEINPNYSFNEDRAEQELNPDYDTNYEGGSVQPKLSKYKSKEYFELFAPTKDSEGNYVATKNKELFNTVEIFKNYQRKTLENINEEGTNIYRLPQMSKTNQEKFAGLFSKEGKLTDKIKEAYLDIAKYRADDLVQGQRVSGKQVIPKYYFNDVDGGVEDLSLDLMSTYYLMSKESSLYKARRKHIGKAVALQDKIINRQYKDGKVSSESNTASMVRSFMDSSFFGVKETVAYKKKILGYEVDVAKMARNLLGAVKFRNLGLNAIIPATSYLTAETNTFIERLIGERVHKSSYNKAIPEFGRLAGDAMTEIGKDYTESPLNVLGEFFGVFDAEDRLKNSVQGKFWKNLPKVGHMMHSMGNFPIIPRIMLSTLYDFRFTNDGKIMNFTEFKRMKLMEEGVSDKKVINQEWEALSDRNIYDHLDISKTDVTLNMGRVQQTLGDGVQFDQDYIDKKVIDIKKFVSRNVADIDGQIPSDKKITAQRNFMLNFVMTHKSWLSIATSNRTKSKHFNTSTGLYEEGNYGSMVRVFGEIFEEVRKQGLPNTVKAMKTVWDNTDEVGRLSLRRTSVDFVAFSALGLLASVLMGYADEEENQDVWSLQLANLLMLRTLNETGGSTLGLHNSYFDTIKNVFVGLDLVKTGLSLNHYFDDKVITKGIYKGKTIRERQMIKLTPGAKQVLDLSQLDVTTKTFLQFNEDNIALTPSLNYFLFDKDKEPK